MIMWSLIFIATISTLLYFRRSLLFSTACLTVLLALYTNTNPGVFNYVVWTLFLALAIPLNLPQLRRNIVSNKILAQFRRIMPSMSETERDALESGSVWWDGDLFSGKPNWDKLLAVPKAELSREEREFIEGPVEELCDMLDDWKITQQDYDLPPEVWQFLKDHRFFGMIIPKRYGGLGFSAYAHSTVVMKISGRSITAAVTVMVPNSLGPAELLLNYGSDEQKQHYLQRLANGEEVPCFALTSPEAGSDAASMIDTGVICKSEFEGQQDVLGIRLNWDKRYITLGPVATVLGLAFKLYDPDKLLGDKTELGITCALIPTNTPGVEIGSRHFPLNSAFQNGPNRGKNVFIPIDWIIGGRAGAGRGWRMLMECLAAGRSISLPAQSTGAGKLVSRATGAYASVRQQFNTSIGRFEGVEEVLSRIAGITYMMDAARTMTAKAIDIGEKPSVISAIVKYNLTEGMRKVVNDAMDVHGGSGICMGPRNILARVYQAIPISITVEGANILTRSLIIFGQGAIRSHPYVLTELQAAQNSDHYQGNIDFDRAFFGHIGFTLSNAVRALWLGLSQARFVKPPVKGVAGNYYRHLTRFSAAFALSTDFAMLVLGGGLKRKEKLSGRLADVLGQLYLASACLKRFHDQGQHEEDIPLLKWSCEYSLRHIQQSLDRFLVNFPNRPIAWFLRRLIFPLGTTFKGPTDALGRQVAKLILQPSDARDRLTEGVYLPTAADAYLTEPLGRLEYALHCSMAAEEAERKLRSAVKSGKIDSLDREQRIRDACRLNFLSKDEVELLFKADASRKEALAVDEFDKLKPEQMSHSHSHAERVKETA